MPSTRLLAADPEDKRARLISTYEELCAERDALVISLLPRINASDPISSNTSPAKITSPSTGTSKQTGNDTSDVYEETSSAKSMSNPPSEAQIASALAFAKATTQHHITQLHNYNEIKDVAQMLMGMLAEQRGVRVVEIMDELGMDPKD